MSTGETNSQAPNLLCNSDATATSPQPAQDLSELKSLAEKLNPDDRLRLISGLWASLPPWHQAAPKPNELAALNRLLDDYDRRETVHFPWEAVKTLIADGRPRPALKLYSVPRRFDLATIFVVTLAYSLLFGAMKAIGIPGIASLAVAGFISIIGLAQAFMFGSKHPRTASVIAGTLVYLICVIAAWLINGRRMYPAGAIVIVGSYTLIGGAILGYLAGVAVGSVFLVADKVRNRFSRKREKAEPHTW